MFEKQSLNWAELWQKVEAASTILKQYLGYNEQKVAALLLPNSIDFIIVYLAILHKGHIAFPLDPAYKQLELDAIVEEIPSKILITNENYRRQIGEHKTPLVMVDEFLKGQGKPEKPLRLPVDKQIASLTFTSGTTGRPKAVPNTHANHVWSVEVCSSVWEWTEKDSLLISIPLSHWYGLVMGICAALYHGSTLYLIDQRFDAQKTLQILASGKISIFQHISIVYLKLLQAEGDYDLSRLRLCISGGAPLPPDVWRQFKERFGAEILETYGSSETGRIAANNLEKRMLGSPGKILPGVDMKLSEDGEVLIKSPGVFPGYFHNLSATKAAFQNEYFRTGDIGEMRGGYLFLKGRMSERIRRFGYTISPRDVEWAMYKNPLVRDIYVMGRQRTDEPNDELIYFVEGDITDQQIEDYCKQSLIFSWRPDKIIHLSNLPRTPSGKPRIAKFRQLVEHL